MDILNVIWALLGVGFLIFVHELGHFLAAKRVGIRVETFALGFQPTIFGFRARFCAFKWGETEYVIGMLPFGGYVKMAGEEPSEEKTGAEDEFASKKPGERALVLVAGAVMNLIFGFIFFIVAYSIGVPVRSTEIVVSPGGQAWQAGLRTGDIIREVEGKPVDEFTEVIVNVLLASSDGPLEILVERDGEERRFEVTPTLDSGLGMLAIGVHPAISAKISRVEKGSPAEEAGLSRGDEIRQVTLVSEGDEVVLPGSLPASSWTPILELFTTNHPNGKLRLQVRSGDEERSVEVPLQDLPDDRMEERLARSGAATQSRVIASIRSGSPAGEVFQKNDEVVALNGEPIHLFDAIAVGRAAAGEPEVQVTLSSGEVKAIPTARLIDWLARDLDVRAVPVQDSGDGADDQEEKDLPQILGRVMPGSPAERAGLKPGDRIVTIEGKEISSFEDYRKAVLVEKPGWFAKKKEPGPLEVVVDRGGESVVLSLTPSPFYGYHGIVFQSATHVKQAGLLGACALGYHQTVNWSLRVFMTLKALFKRDVSAKNLSGPVGIIATTKASAQQGLAKLLWLLALISVNLGIFNLLPFPILDGGHLTFLAIEKIKGSPVSDTVMHYSHLIAFFALIGLAIFVTYHDIMRIFQR